MILALLDKENELFITQTIDGNFNFFIGEKKLEDVSVSKSGTEYTLIINNKPFIVDVKQVGSGEILISYQNRQYTISSGHHRTTQADTSQKSEKLLKSFMPGKILKIYVKPGDKVQIESPLYTLEAMKMENEVRSDVAGTIKNVFIGEGDIVEGNTQLIEFE